MGFTEPPRLVGLKNAFVPLLWDVHLFCSHMILWQDPLGKERRIDSPPRRIVSLVPSQTELLHDIGLEEEVVGITKFCIHPASWRKTKARVGGTKDTHPEKVAALQPDLIIANKEENSQEHIEWLARRFPLWMSDIFTLNDALEMIQTVGDLCYRTHEAIHLARRIQEQFDTFSPNHRQWRVAYFIWNRPMMSINNNTFIHDIITRMGGVNVFGTIQESRYPEISEQVLQEAQPELILLSSEPYPFKEKHIAYFQGLCPLAKVALVDGEMFSWYGSRLLKTPDYLRELLTAVT